MGALRTKRKMTKLCTVIGTDLLSAREKLIKNEIGGLYNISDDLAYCKLPKDKASLTVKEFEDKLKKEIDSHFCVVFNPTVTQEHKIEGHSIYFFIPAWDSYIPVCKVGRSNDNIIPAESKGKVVSYKGSSYKAYGIFDEEPILWRGWVAAYEACKLAYEDWDRYGIEPSRALSANEIAMFKKAYSLKVGAKDIIKDFVERSAKEKLIQELANKEQNLVYWKQEDMHKFVSLTDDNQNMFMDNKEYSELTPEKKEDLFKHWRELTKEEVELKIEEANLDAVAIKEDIDEKNGQSLTK